MKPFLTAEWRKLILLTYSVSPRLVQTYLPDGLEPDTIDGRAFVSLVAFEFRNTKVRGLPVPFHINFPEINLRCYVKHGEDRGVLFIKEFVPRKCIALVANRVYNEPYEAIGMTSDSYLRGEQLVVEHEFKYDDRVNEIRFIVEKEPVVPDSTTNDHFFKEHEWGYGVNHKNQLTKYRVEHPVWRVFPLKTRFHLDVDFGSLYGEQWAFLNAKIPYNILVAEGSKIKVFPGEVIQ